MRDLPWEEGPLKLKRLIKRFLEGVRVPRMGFWKGHPEEVFERQKDTVSEAGFPSMALMNRKNRIITDKVGLNQQLETEEGKARIEGFQSLTKSMAQRIARRGTTMAAFMENKPTIPSACRPSRSPSRKPPSKRKPSRPPEDRKYDGPGSATEADAEIASATGSKTIHSDADAVEEENPELQAASWASRQQPKRPQLETGSGGSSGLVAPTVQRPIDEKVEETLERYQKLADEELRVSMELRNCSFQMVAGLKSIKSV